MKDKLLALSVSAILMCLTAVISHGIALNLIGPTPTAQAGDLSQYGRYMAEAKSPHNIHKEFQSFEVVRYIQLLLSRLLDFS